MRTPIKITGLTHRSEEDSINASFDSIERIIEAWQPKVTKQNFSILSYRGILIKDKTKLTGPKPYDRTPIFAIRGTSYILVGYLELSGVFTSLYSSGKDEVTIYQVYPSVGEEINANNSR